MIEPCCAVCGESKTVNLLLFNYGVCLCHRCMETAAQSFVCDNAERKASLIAKAAIKFANGTHEALRGKCSRCGKAVQPSLITRVPRKYGCEPYKLCPDCLKKYKLEKAEEAAQIRMADLSIENNRLRTGLKDLKEEYESFRERTSRVWWGVAVAGFAIGTLPTLMFLNPR